MERNVFFKKIVLVVCLCSTAFMLSASGTVIREHKINEYKDVNVSSIGEYQNEIYNDDNSEMTFQANGIYGMDINVVKRGMDLSSLKQANTRYIIRYDFNLNVSLR